MKKLIRLRAGIVAGAVLAAACSASVGQAAAPAPAFAGIVRTSETVRAAHDAHDLQGATRLAGKPASFCGEVARVYVSRSGKFAALDFDKDYEKALVAVAIGDSIKRLPELMKLEGQSVIITGKVEIFKGQPEIKISSADQIKIVTERL